MSESDLVDPQLRSQDNADLSLVDRIVQVIALDIIEGRYEPGQRILHKEFTERFNVSFGPIREALLKLEKARLVEIIPRRGARVVEPTLEEIEEFMAVRCAVYPVEARAALARGKARELDRVVGEARRLAKLLRSDPAPEKVSAQAYRTGLAMAVAARAPWASEIIHVTTRQPRWGQNIRSIESDAEREEAARGWLRLADAVEARDPVETGAAAEAIIARAIRTMMPKLYKEHGLDAEQIEARMRLFSSAVGGSPARARRANASPATARKKR